MDYLVLHQFTSFGRLLKKGDVVDETLIRSPKLRQSEGKIVPAVPSFKVPEEIAAEQAAPQDTLEGVGDKTPETDPAKEQKTDEKPGGFKLFFNKG